MAKANSLRWQAPGNGKMFDDKLGSNSYMNKRTICVLEYIKNNPKITQNQYELNIKQHLQICANQSENKSNARHFFRPLLFLGFIYQHDDTTLELTLEGGKFLTAYKKEEYQKCKIYILNQLDNTKYPNKATKDIKLQLFPFRILFKILLENSEGIDTNFIKNQLVNIAHNEDISINIEEIPKRNRYDKFYTWVINSLVNIEILTKKLDRYYIADDLLVNIEKLYQNVDFKDFFFDEGTLSCETNNKTSKKRYKRDARLILEAKNRDGFACVIDKSHDSFISKGQNYVEGHHVIPMFQQKNYNFQLDNIENIVSLCPTCHREIHSADDKTEILNKLYDLNKNYMLQAENLVSLADLHKMYTCI